MAQTIKTDLYNAEFTGTPLPRRNSDAGRCGAILARAGELAASAG